MRLVDALTQPGGQPVVCLVRGNFQDYLEHERHNSVRTRNARLAAIHSLFRYAALQNPEDAASIQRVLAIPPKRFDRALVTYPTDDEIDALLAVSDHHTWTGRRDRALLLLAVQTGLRISELIGLTYSDIHLGTGAHVSCHGKGRKDRITPLTAVTVAVLRAWITEHACEPAMPLFPKPGEGASSAAMRSNTESPTTPLKRHASAPPCTTRRSPLTFSGTPRQCSSYTPVSIPA
jgi:integrase